MAIVHKGSMVRIRQFGGGIYWNGGEIETVIGQSDYGLILTVKNASIEYRNRGPHHGVSMVRVETLNGQPVTGYADERPKRFRPPVSGHLTEKLAIMAHKAGGTVTALDALRGLGMASGTMTKVISRLKNDHGFKVTTTQVKDRITGVRYTRYTLAAPDYSA